MIADISWDTVMVAVIVSVFGPMSVGISAELRRRRERAEAKEDALAAKLEARADAEAARIAAEQVAAQAAEAARLLLESNHRVAYETNAVATQLATSQEELLVHQKREEVRLDTITDLAHVTHALVNSDKTSALEREKVLMIATRSALQGQVVVSSLLSQVVPKPASPVDVAGMILDLHTQIASLDSRIASTEVEIENRLRQQRTAEAQVVLTQQGRVKEEA